MRVLLATSIARSHLTAMIPLGWALRAAGHEVLIACQPGQRDTAVATALPTATVGAPDDFMRLHRDHVQQGGPREYRSENALAVMFGAVTEAMVADLVELARQWRPDLVVRDPVTFAAEIAATAIGVPAMRHLWGPDLFGTNEGIWLTSSMRERLDPLFERYGAIPPEQLSDWIVDPCPASMQKPGPGTSVPIRFVPADVPGTMPDWLTRPPTVPRVCVTWGTFSAGIPGSYLVPEVVRALQDLEVEPVIALTASDRALLDPVPARTLVAESLPLHLLLPTCSAIVFHGGGNTMLGAALAGVPQLIVSHMFERKLHGERLAATGAGRHIPAAEATVETIRACVRDLLLDPGYLTAAAELRTESLARPTPAESVADLERIAHAG